jgi:hypothetical protein
MANAGASKPERMAEMSPRLKQNRRQTLVAEACAYRHTLAADGTTAAQHGCAALGLHTRAETVRLHASAAIGLKCALGHENALLFPG